MCPRLMLGGGNRIYVVGSFGYLQGSCIPCGIQEEAVESWRNTTAAGPPNS